MMQVRKSGAVLVRASVTKVVTAVVGGFVAMLAVYAVLLLMRSGQALERSEIFGLGLLVPVVAGAMVGALAWALLSDGDEGSDPTHQASATCAACGAPVMPDWRLCPNCGRFVDETHTGELPTQDG